MVAPMTSEEFLVVARLIGLPDDELADELGIAGRTLRRWRDEGTDGPNAFLLRLLVRMTRMGIAWRQNEVSIRIGPSGIVMLDDASIAQRLA